MKNPWEDINLDIYEKHMSSNSVSQLQILNKIMNSQLNEYNVSSACIFGVTGGNGLEYIDINKYDKIYAIDINQSFLKTVKERFLYLDKILECKKIDLSKDYFNIPNAELIIANLLIEYIGYNPFQNAIQKANPLFVSCVIQMDTSDKNWLSDSPYINAFNSLDKVHHKIDKDTLINMMKIINYSLIKNEVFDLPNGKKFIRLDFKKLTRTG